MGIVNITPDSFYDGGRYETADRAVEHAVRLVRDGADILDIGGESTRPGSRPVTLEEELSRVLPVVERVAAMVDVPISVDTTKAEVARLSLSAGASIINDISGMTFDPDMLGVAAESTADIILMHTRGRPETMQNDIRYSDVVEEVLAFLNGRIEAAVQAGIGKDRIIIDPGIGFGKSVRDNYTIINRLERFGEAGCRIMIGLSRKSLIKHIQPEGTDRLPATLTLNVCAVQNGAQIIRVHDVLEHRFALNALEMLRSSALE
ncbi:MAG: dihydropteroate synthase [Spirochaetota bacterium]